MSLLELTLQSYRRRESHDESSVSTTVADSDKTAPEKSVGKKNDTELRTPSNFDARMKNIFEAIVELHLNICYPTVRLILVYVYNYYNVISLRTPQYLLIFSSLFSLLKYKN